MKLAAYKFDSALGNVGQVANAGTGLADKGDIAAVIVAVMKGLFAATGFVFFCLMFYAGYIWMTAHGNEDRVTKAKDILTAALIGIAIIVAGYGVTVFIAGRATGATP